MILQHEVVAKNYGADHANKIHNDEGAAKYGFSGALVPGVAIYAYMTRPAIGAFGIDWLERGYMSAKFLKPVYDRDKITVNGKYEGEDGQQIAIELCNSSGQICAVSTAGMPDGLPHLESRDYPEHPLPKDGQLRPASISAVRTGDLFGSIEFKLDLKETQARFLDDIVESMSIYRGDEAICHPAFWIAKANEIVMNNVALGPWIHTASRVQHCDLARHGEKISVRGRVVESYEKRGNEFITLDLGVFGDEERPIAHIIHSAIIKLREPE